MHLYAFGSVCRGEIDSGSDVDLLAVVAAADGRFDPLKFSVYSYERIDALWREGNPFAWHLFRESRLLYAHDGRDLLRLSEPGAYRNALGDCVKFRQIFVGAAEALRNGSASPVFELGTAFLAIRNVAICFSLGCSDEAVFARDAALLIGDHSLVLERSRYEMLSAARLLSTRGIGRCPSQNEVRALAGDFDHILSWIDGLVSIVRGQNE
jgi:hypothetical protein